MTVCLFLENVTAFGARSLTENPVLISDGIPQPLCSTHVVMWSFPSTSRLKHVYLFLKLINAPAVFVENKAVLYNLNTLTQAVGAVVIRREKHVT